MYALPGVAKFGIALGSGPRGHGFKSRHSDHITPDADCVGGVFILTEAWPIASYEANKASETTIFFAAMSSSPDTRISQQTALKVPFVMRFQRGLNKTANQTFENLLY